MLSCSERATAGLVCFPEVFREHVYPSCNTHIVLPSEQIMCHIAVTHLPHTPFNPLTLHTHACTGSLAQIRNTYTLSLLLGPDQTLLKCSCLKKIQNLGITDRQFRVSLILKSSLFIHPSVLLSLSQLPPTQQSLLLFSRVSMSNCSGP